MYRLVLPQYGHFKIVVFISLELETNLFLTNPLSNTYYLFVIHSIQQNELKITVKMYSATFVVFQGGFFYRFDYSDAQVVNCKNFILYISQRIVNSHVEEAFRRAKNGANALIRRSYFDIFCICIEITKSNDE